MALSGMADGRERSSSPEHCRELSLSHRGFCDGEVVGRPGLILDRTLGAAGVGPALAKSGEVSRGERSPLHGAGR